MRRIQNRSLAELLMQLKFTPERKRRKQLDSAEKLYAIVQTGKDYPFEFVSHGITGFQHKEPLGQKLITGKELQRDLRIFITTLSGQIASPVVDQKEKVYTVEELAEHLSISTKTVHRWRTRGLLARKFIFADGKKRVGIFQSALDNFFQDNPELVEKAKSFQRLTKGQRQQIIKRASLLGGKGGASRHQIIEQICAETGRSHETIRYTILDYEKAHPDKSVFGGRGGVVSPSQAAEMYKLYQQGVGAHELMERFNRSKSSVYRIINRRRAKALLVQKVDFIASDEFVEDGAAGKILSKPDDWDDLVRRRDKHPIRIAQKDSITGTDSFELAGESLLPEYLRRLKDAPALDRDQEMELFRRYNYLKYLASVRRAGMSSSKAASERIKMIENYLDEAEAIKNVIIEANLRLVVNIAMKHGIGGVNLSELVSEGNFSLMGAVETFDYTRGYRFGTHASWVITKDFARKTSGQTDRRAKSGAALAGVHRDLRTAATADVVAVERARLSLTQVIKENLNEREQYVILNHFGLLGSPVKKKRKTLREIGEDLDLSKERIRQVELVALQKLRQSLSTEQFELLTG